jgi:carbamate kinase
MTAGFMELSSTDRVLVAIGGNAIHPEGGLGTAAEQTTFAARTGQALLPLLLRPNQLVLTHGNGPVVGKILLRQMLSRSQVPQMPMDICVAHSQGGIAYLLMQAFENALRRVGNPRHVVCLLTQVEVDANDAAFANPTKPLGFFYSEAEARQIEAELGWPMREDAGRGWRYVVPSPAPVHIADISQIETVTLSGAAVIAGGGGGIPVVRQPDGTRSGVNAVVDKDLTSAKMASVLGFEVLLILTATPNVSIYFGTPNAQALQQVSVDELRGYYEAGHFPAGSMGPKVEAALKFVQDGGKRAIIAHLDDAEAALQGLSGTQILPA